MSILEKSEESNRWYSLTNKLGEHKVVVSKPFSFEDGHQVIICMDYPLDVSRKAMDEELARKDGKMVKFYSNYGDGVRIREAVRIDETIWRDIGKLMGYKFRQIKSKRVA